MVKLREKAEAVVRQMQQERGDFTAEEVKRLLHDLQVHQVELEMQNEELRKTQRDLETSRDRYSQLYNQAPVGYLTIDANGIILQANQTIAQMLSVDPGDMPRKPFSSFIDPTDRDVFFARFRAFYKRPSDKSMEIRLICRGGPLLHAKLEGRVMEPPGAQPRREGETGLLLVSVTDITERVMAEEALRQNEENLSITLQSIGDAVITTDVNENVTRMNAVAEALTGWSLGEALGKPVRQAFHIVSAETREEVDSPVTKALREGCIVGLANHTILIGRDGSERQIADSGAPIRNAHDDIVGVVLVFRDVTAQVKLEEQYRQAQKMEAVGQLAGGVAHDFNNLLQVIFGHIEMALDEVSPLSPVHSDLVQVRQAANRAATLVRQLLAFSRRQAMSIQKLDLNEAISNVIKMLGRVIGEHITLDFLPGHGLHMVNADSSQIEQMLLNLCINARDAMPEGGRITIETRSILNDRGFQEQNPWARESHYIMVTFSDTGPGIPVDLQQHVFEPFFTTKEVGKGTGLGLAMVYGIVKQHEGMIYLESTPAKGAVFHIFFPAAGLSLPVRQGSEEVSTRDFVAPPPPSGGTTILLAEDDPMVRDLAHQILSKAGYRVMVARDGQEALDIFDRHTQEIDLALIDVIMPKVSGRSVAEHIRSASPHLPILFSTGYDFNLLDADFHPGKENELVQKPYERYKLLRKVQNMLAGG